MAAVARQSPVVLPVFTVPQMRVRFFLLVVLKIGSRRGFCFILIHLYQD